MTRRLTVICEEHPGTPSIVAVLRREALGWYRIDEHGHFEGHDKDGLQLIDPNDARTDTSTEEIEGITVTSFDSPVRRRWELECPRGCRRLVRRGEHIEPLFDAISAAGIKSVTLVALDARLPRS